MSNGDWEILLVGLGFIVVVGLPVAVMVLHEGARTRGNLRAWAQVAERLGLVASRSGVSGHWQGVEVSAEYRRGELFVCARQSAHVVGSVVGAAGKVVVLEEGPARVVDAVRQVMERAPGWDVRFHHGELMLSRKTLTVDLEVGDTLRLAAETCGRIEARQSYRQA